jgi:hypothetical protein
VRDSNSSSEDSRVVTIKLAFVCVLGADEVEQKNGGYFDSNDGRAVYVILKMML